MAPWIGRTLIILLTVGLAALLKSNMGPGLIAFAMTAVMSLVLGEVHDALVTLTIAVLLLGNIIASGLPSTGLILPWAVVGIIILTAALIELLSTTSQDTAFGDFLVLLGAFLIMVLWMYLVVPLPPLSCDKCPLADAQLPGNLSWWWSQWGRNNSPTPSMTSLQQAIELAQEAKPGPHTAISDAKRIEHPVRTRNENEKAEEKLESYSRILHYEKKDRQRPLLRPPWPSLTASGIFPNSSKEVSDQPVENDVSQLQFGDTPWELWLSPSHHHVFLFDVYGNNDSECTTRLQDNGIIDSDHGKLNVLMANSRFNKSPKRQDSSRLSERKENQYGASSAIQSEIPLTSLSQDTMNAIKGEHATELPLIKATEEKHEPAAQPRQDNTKRLLPILVVIIIYLAFF